MPTRAQPIAIVGMAAMFPGAPDLATYWRNILANKDCISDVPEGHSWQVADYFDADRKARDKTWCTRGGFLEAVPFDPVEFGIPPNALDAIDTTQLLSLLVACDALRDAGLDPKDSGWDRNRVSCIVGITGTQELAITLGARLQAPIWRRALDRCGVEAETASKVVDDIANHFPEWQEQSFPGLLGNVVAGRVMNRLGLGGTNCVVDAACASSFGALQLAIADLQAGRSDLALSGGADTLNDIFMYMCFSKTPALSKSGDARPFDASADGILIAEGIGMVALKRLEDAERDNDRIYAVIRGVGSSSDGRSGSIYAPSDAGQARAIRAAHTEAGWPLGSIELIEAHGTGTTAGDAAEFRGLKSVFAETPGNRIGLGSVKSQIGHTKSAAGIAGLIKGALALYEGVLPPTAKVSEPNPKLEIDDTPLYLNTHARPWVRTSDHPRRAGVSAFGFGGSNFHVALEEHGSGGRISAPDAALFVLAAPTAEALLSRVDELRGREDVHALSHEVLGGTTTGAHVVGFVAGTPDELDARLDLAADLIAAGPGHRQGVHYGIPDETTRKLAVLFPGQGSQYVGMGATLAMSSPVARAALDRADDWFLAHRDLRLSDIIHPAPAFTKERTTEHKATLTATEWAQPALGAVALGTWDALRAFGVQASCFAGHSYGELVALHAAGVYDEQALWHLSRARGEAMAEAGGEGDRGTMAAIGAPLADIERAIADIEGVVMANRNHPQQGVISGETEAVRGALATLQEQGLRGKELSVAAAFHSPLVADAEASFTATVGATPWAAPQTPVFANVTGAAYPADPDAGRQLLVQQLTSAVDFVGVVESMVDSGIRTFVECGPKRVLSGLVRHCTKGVDNVAIVTLDPDNGLSHGDTQLKQALAALACRGVALDFAALLDQPQPPAPRKEGGPATVWLRGANFRRPETIAPPKPIVKPRPPVPAPTPTTPIASSTVAPRPSAAASIPLATPSPIPTAAPMSTSVPMPTPGQAPSADLSAALAATRESLMSFQRTQEQIAAVHTEFLRAHAKANESFAALFQAHASLVSQAGGHTVPLPAPTLQAPAAPVPTPTLPMSVPTMPPAVAATGAAAAPTAGTPAAILTSSFLGHEDAGLVQVPVTSRPAVAAAADLPPLMTAASMRGGTPAPALPAAPTPTPAPVSTAPALDLDAILMGIVADKTGYPAQALDPAMDLEADLGIDSIKRVEILAAVQEKAPDLPDLDAEKLSALRTLADVVAAIRAAVPAAAVSPVPAASPQAASPSPDLEAILLETVSDRTGYPKAALEPGMDLESDLGVDSIKRVEILAAVQERIPGLPDLDAERLGALRTLRDVTDALRQLLPQGAPAPVPAAPTGPDPVDVLLETIAAKTGYPRDALQMGMDLESDLGVDSIKRVEILAAVQERIPGMPDLDAERLSALRTLTDVAEALTESMPTAAPPAVTGPTAADVREVLLATVADRTGYPREALQMGMDLESDLGVDSIKRVEILAAVQDRIPSLPELDSETLGALRTLDDVAAQLEAAVGVPAPAAQPASVATEPTTPAASAAPARRIVGITPAQEPSSVELANPIVVTADVRGVAAALATALRNEGHDVQVVDPDWSSDDAIVASLPDKVGTFVHLAAVGASGTDLVNRVRGAFIAARQTGPIPHWIAVSDLGGSFGLEDLSDRAAASALGAFVKTLSHEWTERVLAIDIAPNTPVTRLAAELTSDRGVIEVGLNDLGAWTPTVHLDAHGASDGGSPVDEGSLVVVSGGARGVTAAVVLEMARRWRPTLLLLGRSPIGDDPAWAVGVADDKLEHALIAATPGAPPSPREMRTTASKVRATREARQTLEELAKLGVTCRYAAVDVRDTAAVGAAVEAARAEHGPVRGIIHGAGVLADKKVVDKTPAQFDQVWSTKVEGLAALLDTVDLSELNMLCTFSSVAARYGNAGQCDYAMANQFLTQRVRSLAKRYGLRGRSFDWGPWDGGMVTPSLRRVFQQRGIALIGLEQGARFFVDELERRADDVEVVVGGPLSGPGVVAGPYTGIQTRARGHRTLQVTPDAPYLVDHRIDGRPVLPAAMALEWMAETASGAFPDLNFRGVRELVVLKGVIVEEAQELELVWQVNQTASDETVLEMSLCRIADGRVHYRGRVYLGDGVETPARFPGSNGLSAGQYPYDMDEAYAKFLFHGPRLRGIDRIEGISNHGMVAALQTSDPERLGGSNGHWVTDPLTIDSALQMMVLWVRENQGAAALPSCLESYEQYAPLAGPLTCHLEVTPKTDNSGQFHAKIVDTDERVVAVLKGGQYTANRALNKVFRNASAL